MKSSNRVHPSPTPPPKSGGMGLRSPRQEKADGMKIRVTASGANSIRQQARQESEGINYGGNSQATSNFRKVTASDKSANTRPALPTVPPTRSAGLSARGHSPINTETNYDIHSPPGTHMRPMSNNNHTASQASLISTGSDQHDYQDLDIPDVGANTEIDPMSPSEKSGGDDEDGMHAVFRSFKRKVRGRYYSNKLAFQAFDRSGQGLISRTEFKEALSMLGVELTDSERKRLRMHIDVTNRNGTKRITFQDYEAFMDSADGEDSDDTIGAGLGRSAGAADPFQKKRAVELKGCALYLSYARGHFTTPFVYWLKSGLEHRGFVVWMDEAEYPGQSARLLSICQADIFVALIDMRYCQSDYCLSELGHAYEKQMQVFTLLFRDTSFEVLPFGGNKVLDGQRSMRFENTNEKKDEAQLRMLVDAVKMFLLVKNEKVAKAITGRSLGEQESSKETPQSMVYQRPTDRDILIKQMQEEVQAAKEKQKRKFESAGEEYVPCAVPSECPGLPLHWQERGACKEQLKRFLIEESSTVTALTVVHGPAGTGKTTLVSSTFQDNEVLSCFECIAWVPVGMNPDTRLCLQLMWQQLTGREEPEHLTHADVGEKKAALAKELQGKRVLVVLDDVHSAADVLQLFVIDDQGTSKTVITTNTHPNRLLKGVPISDVALSPMTHFDAVRLLDEVADLGLEQVDMARQFISEVNDGELGEEGDEENKGGRFFFGSWRKKKKVNRSKHKLSEDAFQKGCDIVRLCGCLPLTVQIVGHMLMEHGTGWEKTIWEHLMTIHSEERLKQNESRDRTANSALPLNMEGETATGEEVLDNHSALLVTSIVARASLESVVRPKQREEMEKLLLAMCVLPGNMLLPITVCDVIWQHALQPDATQAVKRRSKLRSRQLLSCLMDRGLVEGSMQSGWCFLHHLVRDFCVAQHSEQQLSDLHKAMAKALLENR